MGKSVIKLLLKTLRWSSRRLIRTSYRIDGPTTLDLLIQKNGCLWYDWQASW